MTDDTQKRHPDGKGMENLTEVLRLQAEALARISERMAGQQGQGAGNASALAVPPRLNPGGSQELPVLSGDPALSGESLPVLNAFRKFIDAERRRARIRMMWLSLCFAVLLAGVLGAVLYLMRARVDELQTDIRGARQQVTEVRSSTDAELKRMAEASARLTMDINRGLSMAQSNVAHRIGTREGEIEQLRETISTLEIDNAMLAGKLKEIVERTEQLQTAYMAQMAQMPPSPEAQRPSGAEVLPATNRFAPALPVAPQVQFRLPALP